MKIIDKTKPPKMPEKTYKFPYIELLVKRRKGLGLTGTDVAKKLSISRSLLSAYEKEKVEIQFSTLEKWADVLGMKVILSFN